MTLKFKNKFEIQPSTGSGGGSLITKTITANGTYNASDDGADGYSQVVVNIEYPSLQPYIGREGGSFIGTSFSGGSSAYLYNNTKFDIQNADSWEIGMKFSYNGGGDKAAFVIGRKQSVSNLYSPLMVVTTAKKLNFLLSSNNSAWDIWDDSTSLAENITEGSVYEVIVSFDGSKYTAKVGIDGATPTTVRETTNSNKVYCAGYFMFMNDYTEGITRAYSSGNLYLLDSYFKIDSTTYKFMA